VLLIFYFGSAITLTSITHIFSPETQFVDIPPFWAGSFAIALIVGIAVGTYSSIYVASNVLLLMNVSKEDLMIPVKEGADQEDLTP
jgi:preprotein translocase subunit SecF